MMRQAGKEVQVTESTLRYALAQINVTVGDLEGNAARILAALRDARAYSPDLLIFPELTLAGYPPEDLLLKPGFFEACEAVFAELVPQIDACALIGYPLREGDGTCYNAAALIAGGRVEVVYRKILLPNYSVFDEKRYFTRGEQVLVTQIAGQHVGVQICEDAWEDEGPTADEAGAGARVIANLSASPFHRAKSRQREETFARLCRRHDVWFLYCNLVGGQDELVFDGGSLVIDPQGSVVARGKEFEEDLLVVDLPKLPDKRSEQRCGGRTVRRCVVRGAAAVPAADKPALPLRSVEKLAPMAEVYSALVLGVRDYVRKNGFRGVVIGISGGVDSALSAVIAVDALGVENVLGVTMPSCYSSSETVSDAELVAENLGIPLHTLPIEDVATALRSLLAPLLEGVQGDPENVTDQNLQARVRAILLMALSNKLGLLVLNTSNKSETAVGYGTLYGDMIGGYGAIKDVLKTQVWELSRYANQKHGREIIPESTIRRAPSAELRADQKDTDSLPDYALLDAVLEMYVEQDMTYSEITSAGHDADTVREIVRRVDRNEFKRRQAVPGARVTPKAFGRDRRLPITNRFRQWPRGRRNGTRKKELA